MLTDAPPYCPFKCIIFKRSTAAALIMPLYTKTMNLQGIKCLSVWIQFKRLYVGDHRRLCHSWQFTFMVSDMWQQFYPPLSLRPAEGKYVFTLFMCPFANCIYYICNCDKNGWQKKEQESTIELKEKKNLIWVRLYFLWPEKAFVVIFVTHELISFSYCSYTKKTTTREPLYINFTELMECCLYSILFYLK